MNWIKMRVSLRDDPRVLRMAVDLGTSEAEVIGALFLVWSWADTHSEDGNAICVTKALLDRYSGVTGFTDALEKVGWLTENGDNISFPNFEEHNGATAKRRAQTARRVSKHKASSQQVTQERYQGNATVTQGALPREEKIREETSTHTPTPTRARPTQEDVEQFALGERLDSDTALTCFFHYDATATPAGWINGNNQPIQWQSKVKQWCHDDKRKQIAAATQPASPKRGTRPRKEFDASRNVL